jgi:hypothetical protein
VTERTVMSILHKENLREWMCVEDGWNDFFNGSALNIKPIELVVLKESSGWWYFDVKFNFNARNPKNRKPTLTIGKLAAKEWVRQALEQALEQLKE